MTITCSSCWLLIDRLPLYPYVPVFIWNLKRIQTAVAKCVLFTVFSTRQAFVWLSPLVPMYVFIWHLKSIQEVQCYYKMFSFHSAFHPPDLCIPIETIWSVLLKDDIDVKTSAVLGKSRSGIEVSWFICLVGVYHVYSLLDDDAYHH